MDSARSSNLFFRACRVLSATPSKDRSTADKIIRMKFLWRVCRSEGSICREEAITSSALARRLSASSSYDRSTIGAQYGGGQTAIANFAIKSGTNALHGSAAAYVQNDVLRANGFVNNALGRPRAPYKLFNWAAAGGGPVYIPKVYDGRNKSFFFVSYERTRVRDFVSNSRITLPATAFKSGDYPDFSIRPIRVILNQDR